MIKHAFLGKITPKLITIWVNDEIVDYNTMPYIINVYNTIDKWFETLEAARQKGVINIVLSFTGYSELDNVNRSFKIDEVKISWDMPTNHPYFLQTGDSRIRIHIGDMAFDITENYYKIENGYVFFEHTILDAFVTFTQEKWNEFVSMSFVEKILYDRNKV